MHHHRNDVLMEMLKDAFANANSTLMEEDESRVDLLDNEWRNMANSECSFTLKDLLQWAEEDSPAHKDFAVKQHVSALSQGISYGDIQFANKLSFNSVRRRLVMAVSVMLKETAEYDPDKKSWYVFLKGSWGTGQSRMNEAVRIALHQIVDLVFESAGN